MPSPGFARAEGSACHFPLHAMVVRSIGPTGCCSVSHLSLGPSEAPGLESMVNESMPGEWIEEVMERRWAIPSSVY